MTKIKRFICDLTWALTFRNVCFGWCSSKKCCKGNCDC